MRIERSVAGSARKRAPLAGVVSIFGFAVFTSQPDRVLQAIPQPHTLIILRIVVPGDRIEQVSLPMLTRRALPAVDFPRAALPLLARFVR